MKEIPLLELYQKGKTFYLAALDPKQVIRLVKLPPKNTNQDINRPWKDSRVRDISKYVAGKLDISEEKGKTILAQGYLANCPILSLNDIFTIKKCNGFSYLLFPESSSEFLTYYGNVSILDGQHRLISFTPEYIDPNMSNLETYSMGFVLFIGLTTSEMREIFMITNDKQEKVETNVLRLLKSWLGLLSKREDYLYNLVTKLNKENISILKDKIIIGGQKIPNGFKASQLAKIFDKSGMYDTISELSEDKQIKYICSYLSSWNEAYSGIFNNPKHFLGKTTGLRYTFYLFKYITDILKSQKMSFTKQNITIILDVLYKLTFTTDNEFSDKEVKLAVRSESGTIAIARLHGEKLKRKFNEQNKEFDIFAL